MGIRVVAFGGWVGLGEDAEVRCSPVSCRQAEPTALSRAAGLLLCPPVPWRWGKVDLSAGLPAALQTPCVSSFLVLSLWILGSGQVAVVKPGAVYVSAAPRPVWPQSSLAQLCLLAMQGGSTVLGHVLIAAVWAPSPGFPD